MRITAVLVTAKWCNKFVILHKKGMLFDARPKHSASAEPCPQSSASSSALRRPDPPTRRWFARKMASKGRRHFFGPLCSPSTGGWHFRRLTSRRIVAEKGIPLSVLPPPRLRDGSRPPRLAASSFFRPSAHVNKGLDVYLNDCSFGAAVPPLAQKLGERDRTADIFGKASNGHCRLRLTFSVVSS
jgi:hypothetical protein